VIGRLEQLLHKRPIDPPQEYLLNSSVVLSAAIQQNGRGCRNCVDALPWERLRCVRRTKRTNARDPSQPNERQTMKEQQPATTQGSENASTVASNVFRNRNPHSLQNVDPTERAERQLADCPPRDCGSMILGYRHHPSMVARGEKDPGGRWRQAHLRKYGTDKEKKDWMEVANRRHTDATSWRSGRSRLQDTYQMY